MFKRILWIYLQQFVFCDFKFFKAFDLEILNLYILINFIPQCTQANTLHFTPPD
jgi:hypothetical protein